MALDNYDKEEHSLARRDREEKLVKAAEDVLEEFNNTGAQSVSMEIMAKLAVAVQDNKSERKRMGLLPQAEQWTAKASFGIAKATECHCPNPHECEHCKIIEQAEGGK